MTARLMRKIIEESASVRDEVVLSWVMVKTDGDLTLANIQALYTTGDDDTRWLILLAAKVTELPGIEPQLRTIIQNESNLDLRIMALRALAELKDTSAVSIIEGLFNHPDSKVVNQARVAYEYITGQALKRG